ncbi:MAG TPA: aldehyde dehydrogenase family protein, partial [Pseudoxanthomonas sp.]|nr:aldehyde dehydrogenase family protein [Pseudoxanthomonas sp.]
MSYKLTYATMFDPPEDLHARFDAALAEAEAALGADHLLHVAGVDCAGVAWDERRSPIDRRRVIGRFALADPAQAAQAIEAAHAAFPAWRATPVAERVRLLKRVAVLIEERVYLIAAALTLEVGKNRMEALGEVQETADFFRHYAEDFERHDGFDHVLPDDPLPDFRSHNRSVMRPYGVWVVIAPFNFPFALAGGPVAAALVTGNTVVFKSATDTPWSGRLLADCLRDAGFPVGVFHYLNGDGSEVGQALVDHPRTAGITFTGSFEVGMRLYRAM